MAEVHVLKPFSYKGKSYQEGDTLDMAKANIERYAKLDYVKAAHKTATTKEAAGPIKPAPKTK